MNKNFDNLTWYSQERYNHYHSADFMKCKAIGDQAEERVYNYFNDGNHYVRYSTSEEDSKYHVDLWIDGQSYDVKCKKKFYVELTNNWGKPGWIYTGANYIVQTFQDSNVFYIYKRQDMLDWLKNNTVKTTRYGNAVLCEITSISALSFLEKHYFK